MSALESLTSSEAARFARLEIVIENGVSTFVKVGEALMEIRNKRLYRGDFDTFEDYCQVRWALHHLTINSRQRAHQVITASQVSKIFDADDGPQIESHARELAPLLDEPEKLQRVWKKVNADDEPVTAAKVREAVHEELPVLEARIVRPKTNLKEAARNVIRSAVRDGRAYTVPIRAMEELMRAAGEHA